MIRFATLVLACVLAACGGAPTVPATTTLSAPPPIHNAQATPERIAPPAPVRPRYISDEDRLADAVAHAAPGPRRVLETVRTMLSEGTIVRGSCWDWVHAIYVTARGDTNRVFGARLTGPFADVTLIQPGDWIYLNHVDRSGTHSAIFVSWADEPNRVALMVSYAGNRSDTPGRFGHYDLSRVYRIMRLSDSIETPPPPRRAHRHHSR